MLRNAGTRRRGCRAASAWAMTAALLTVAACGSSSTDAGEGAPSSSGGSGGAGQPQSLTIAVGGSSIILSDLVVAYEKGYFREQNLDVKLDYLGVSAAQAALAGKADLAYSTPTQTFSAIAAGRSVKTIWSSTLVNTSFTVAVPSSSPAHSIDDLAGKVIGTYPVGSASYGDAQLLANLITSHGGAAPKIKPLGDATAISSQLAGKRIDAGMAAGDFFAPLVEQHKVRILAEPDQFKDLPEYDFVNSGMFGLTSTLEKKKDAVQRLTKAMVKAASYITTAPPADVGALLHGSSQGDYANQSADALTTSLTADRWFLDKSAGCVSPKAWAGTLSLSKGFKLPLSGKTLDDPVFAFKAGTDMSFVNAAGVTC